MAKAAVLGTTGACGQLLRPAPPAAAAAAPVASASWGALGRLAAARIEGRAASQGLNLATHARGSGSLSSDSGRRQLRGSRLRVAQADLSSAATDEDEAADYYQLLGVSFTASTDEIKRAYRRLAKEFHPDVSNDESSTEFAIFLNEVYETLLDPDKRAAYDAIAGFQVGGINPFMDTSYERDMVFVDEFTCIGCRNCNNVCASTFMMEDEWGRARVRQQGVDGVEKLQEAIDTCPVSCIHWVSAPQLALLEETMSRMERVAAWLLMTGGGKGANLNVFAEAAMGWEKRQAALRAKEQVAQSGWGMWRSSPAMGSTMQDSARRAAEAGGDGGTGASPLGRGANAATIAAAARKWRDYQRAKRNKEQRLLTTTSSLSSTDASA